ncbi:unnamed protein product [Euphydryas editha]|uniref:Uncharacterized protein n=1 Tax=Euphydryas editha TaxID=104508 RepID=A0AAU9TG78_EUPED|nr:unnamed protein product [Euphydryas editha]
MIMHSNVTIPCKNTTKNPPEMMGFSIGHPKADLYSFKDSYFSVLVKLLSGYLLFAANFEDFHTIAKKLGAENFPTSFVKNPSDRGDAASYEGGDYERSFEIQQKSHHQNHKNHANSKSANTKIDFDELVERVKKRIEKELKEKYNIKKDTEITITNNKKENDNNNDYSTHKQEVKKNVKETSTIDYDTEYVEDVTDRPKKSFTKKEKILGKSKKTTKAIVEEERLEYADAAIEMTTSQKHNKKSTYNDEYSFETVTYTYPTENDDMINQEIRTTKNNFVSEEVKNLPFKKIRMSKKDSYEDYKMPEKETIIYSSTEIKPQTYDINEKRFKIEKQNRKKILTKDTEQTTNGLKSRSKKTKFKKKTTANDDYVDKLVESAEIKAKTAYAKDLDEMPLKENSFSKKVKSATNIPTRERYKTVTPNYYAKLPIVVEKYDFNEPLPERDRERENLKYYGNPPALVNKKIRLL